MTGSGVPVDPQPADRIYLVHVEHYWTYEVAADSPEAAEQIAVAEESAGDCTGYKVTSVSSMDDRFGDTDLREPLACRGGCGKLLPASCGDECTKCLLRRIESQNRARKAATDV